MASTDFDFIQERNALIEQALGKVGALTLGEVMSAEQVLQGARVLNSMIKHWQSKHIHLWTIQEHTESAVAADSFALPTDPGVIAIDRAAYLNDTTEEPIKIISYREYKEIPDKDTAGNPTVICVAPEANPTAYLYPVPDTALDIKLSLITRLKDWESNTESGGFISVWGDALVYGLASRLADDYGLPLAERQHYQRLAETYFLEAKRLDRDWAESDFMEGSY